MDDKRQKKLIGSRKRLKQLLNASEKRLKRLSV